MAAQRQLSFVDVGAGGGGATAALLDAGGAHAHVYAVDWWDGGAGAYAAQLRGFGHAARAAAWERGDAGGGGGAAAPPAVGPRDSLFSLFCARFWRAQDRVTPVRAGAAAAVAQLDRAGVAPALVWLDADLTEAGAAAILEAVWARWLDPAVRAAGGTNGGAPPRAAPLVGGGGWDASAGVRAAVAAFAAARALPLAIEGGAAWTLSPEAARATRNDAHAPPPPSAAAARAGEALRVRSAEAARAAARDAWLAGAARVIDAPAEDAAALRAALAAAPDAAAAREWLDAADAGDKRHLTLLMSAAKAGKAALVGELLAAGAAVDARAPRSGYTALYLAAYGGHAAAAKALLAAGAGADVPNKWGETARAAAAKRHAGIAALIQEARPK